MSFTEWLQRKEVETVAGRHVERDRRVPADRQFQRPARVPPGILDVQREMRGVAGEHRPREADPVIAGGNRRPGRAARDGTARHHAGRGGGADLLCAGHPEPGRLGRAALESPLIAS